MLLLNNAVVSFALNQPCFPGPFLRQHYLQNPVPLHTQSCGRTDSKHMVPRLLLSTRLTHSLGFWSRSCCCCSSLWHFFSSFLHLLYSFCYRHMNFHKKKKKSHEPLPLTYTALYFQLSNSVRDLNIFLCITNTCHIPSFLKNWIPVLTIDTILPLPHSQPVLNNDTTNRDNAACSTQTSPCHTAPASMCSIPPTAL